MIKIFGLRITPFFLLIIGLQCLALLISIYVAILLYQDTAPFSVSYELIDHSLYSGLFLVVLLSILTPGFFYQTKVISYAKKTVREKTPALAASVITMILIVATNASELDMRTLFIAALLSACVGMIMSQLGLLGKYWRFLIHSGMN